MRLSLLLTCALAAATIAAGAPSAADSDPYLWLADIHGAKALDWVRAQDVRSDAALKSDPRYVADRTAILNVLNAQDRIPEGSLEHDWVLNFWQDAQHVRGIWRRASISEYARPSPHWQTLLDLDALDASSHQDWVWKGADCTPSFDRCLVSLSPGGGDAVVVREYDPRARQFIADGFSVSLAKTTAQYLDENDILIATDFGPGTITPSSYPRIVKLWRRGKPLAAAKTIFEARSSDMSANPRVFRGPYGVVALVERKPSFFRSDFYLIGARGALRKVPLPQDAQLQGVTRGELLATLQDDWHLAGRTIPAGSLIALPVHEREQNTTPAAVQVLFTPDAHAMIDEVSAGRDAVYASVYQDVTGSIHEFRPGQGSWRDERLKLPAGGSIAIVSTNDFGPQAYFLYQSFLTPPTLYAYDGLAVPRAIKAQPARFDASALRVDQYWVSSRDGTRVPYFLIRPKNSSGPLPTILYGYGGFQLSLTPWYWNDGHKPLDAGQTWLTRGGALAVANIRGGGEFGPAWHQAALKYHRQRAYDDFEAVAADIERRGFATRAQLGIVGASNGGLLVTTVMVERPDLLGAVVCQRPLIDMLRYTHYGAGASWIGEYGDPSNPQMAAYIRRYSPYQNVKPAVSYPPILFITETSDDRVTPVFARMMAAKMEAQGHEVLFNETLEGGHGPGATHAEEAEYWALSYTFLARHLGLPSGRPAG